MVDVNRSEYIKHLEHKVDDMEDMVKGLKYKLAIAGGRKHSKKELRQSYEWNEDNVSFSDIVISFCKEFCFPTTSSLERGGQNSINKGTTVFCPW